LTLFFPGDLAGVNRCANLPLIEHKIPKPA